MIIRLFSFALRAVVSFCAATLMAEALLAGYLAYSWKIDRDKLIQILAVAQGVDLFGIRDQHKPKEDDSGAEQPSYEDIIERRVMRTRDIEIRELALRNDMDQLKFEQRRLAEEQAKFQRHKEDFEAQLIALQEGAEAEGMVNVRLTLESLKPKQAKIQLLEMLQNDEIDVVVQLLSEMSARNKAKILTEFKDDVENKQVAEVLRRLRQGEPTSAMASQALDQLGAN